MPFVNDHEVALGESHSIYGNPNRFRTGHLRVQADDEWKSGIRTRDRAVVNLLTWPLQARYGY